MKKPIIIDSKYKKVSTIIIFFVMALLTISIVNAVIYFDETHAFYRFEEGSGGIINDSSNYENHGTIYQATYQSSKGTNGTGNYSLLFDGIDDHTDTPHNASLIFGANNFSISVWIRSSSTVATPRAIVSKWDGNFGYWIQYTPSIDTWYMGWHKSAGQYLTFIHDIDDDDWHHIVFRRDGINTGTAYIDAVQQATDATLHAQSSDNTANLFIGQYNPGRYWDGYIDEVAIFNKSLNLIEIEDIYNNGILTEIDDTIPEIVDCKINTTSLSCNNTIRLSCNVTDDNLNEVYFGYNDTAEHFDLITDTIGDTYYKDIQYTLFSLNTTYTFKNASATDTSSNENITLINLDYSYTCLTDDTNPIIQIQLNPTVDKIEFNLTTQANCTDNFNLSSFNMLVYNSSDIIFNGTNISTETDLRLQIYELIDLTLIAIGNYTRNTTCLDNAGNNDFIQDIVTIVDTSPPVISNFIPVNNSVFNIIMSGAFSEIISHSWDTSTTSSCIINISSNTSLINTTSGFTHSFNLEYNENETVEWFINCTTTGSSFSAQTGLLFYNITFSQPPQAFTVTTCPDNIAKSSILFLFFLIAFVMVFLGLQYKIFFFGIFGSILLLISSLYIVSCVNLIGYIIGSFGIISVIYFAFIQKT